MLLVAPVSWAGLVSVVMTGKVDSTIATLPSVQAGDDVTAQFLINLDASGFVLSDTATLTFEGEWIGYSLGITDGTVTFGDSVSLPYAAFGFQSSPGVLMRNDATLFLRGNQVTVPSDGMRFGGLDPTADPTSELEIDGQMVFGYEAFFNDSTQMVFADAGLENVATAEYGDFDSATMDVFLSGSEPGADFSRAILISLDSYEVTVVPIPAAAWLFVSAIGFLGCSRLRFRRNE